MHRFFVRLIKTSEINYRHPAWRLNLAYEYVVGAAVRVRNINILYAKYTAELMCHWYLGGLESLQRAESFVQVFCYFLCVLDIK